MDSQLTTIFANLAELAARNSAQYIIEKIRTTKAIKDDKQTISVLEGIITDLIEDRNELQLTVGALQEYISAEKISKEDIEYIVNNIIPAVEHFVGNSENIPDRTGFMETMAHVHALLKPEMLNIMQLVGFNYKRAIGEPLTDLLAQEIRKNISPQNHSEIQLEAIKRDTELYKTMQDKESYERLRRMLGNE